MENNKLSSYPSPESLLPQKEEAIVVDEIISFEKDMISCIRKVRTNEHYGPGLSYEGIIEFCAQSAILCESLTKNKPLKRGVIAGIDDFTFTYQPKVDDILISKIKITTRFGDLACFECNVFCNNKEIAKGIIKAAQS
jgi:predicted hotdog family 3-hydroxylacyl-ACP dehydratase